MHIHRIYVLDEREAVTSVFGVAADTTASPNSSKRGQLHRQGSGHHQRCRCAEGSAAGARDGGGNRKGQAVPSSAGGLKAGRPWGRRWAVESRRVWWGG